jgi:hypothetical protein
MPILILVPLKIFKYIVIQAQAKTWVKLLGLWFHIIPKHIDL